MELEELHILQRQAATQKHGGAVAGVGIGVGCDRIDTAMTAGGEDDGLGVKGVQLAGGKLHGDHASGPAVDDQQVEDLILIEKVDLVLETLLIEGLEDHVTGSVSSVGRAAHRLAGLKVGVTAERALGDLTVGGAVERQAHVLQLQHGINRLVAHELNGILVAEVVRAFDGVVGMPFGLVFFKVAEGGADPALCRAGVGTGGVELADDGRLRAARGVEPRHEAGAARPDDDYFKFMNIRHAVLPKICTRIDLPGKSRITRIITDVS